MTKNGKAATEMAVGSPLCGGAMSSAGGAPMLDRVGLPDVVSAQKLVAKISILLLNAQGSTLDSHGGSQRRSCGDPGAQSTQLGSLESVHCVATRWTMDLEQKEGCFLKLKGSPINCS